MDSLQSAKRECCKYGNRCYRQNNATHRSELSHPGDEDYKLPVDDNPAEDLPACRYADKCTRRNPTHFQQFSHPSAAASHMQTRVQSAVQVPGESEQVNSLLPSSRSSQESIHSGQIGSLSTPLQHRSVQTRESEHLDSLVTPIEHLIPGIKEYIRARVIIKSDKHLYTNDKGDGILSTIDLIDHSGEIKLSAFGTYVHQLYDFIELDRIYYFSNVRVSRSTGVVKTNQHTLTCTGTTKVLLDHRNDLPRLSFNFESLSAVDVKEKNDVMDVIGICHSIGPAVNVTLRNSEEGLKRELKLIDQSDKEVMVTIWGTNAENFERIYTPGCVIAFKRARVMIFESVKSLESSCLSSSTFQMEPKIVEAVTLHHWFESMDTKSE